MVVILVTIIIFSISLPVPFKEKFSVWILLIFRNLETQVCPPTVDEPFSNRNNNLAYERIQRVYELNC